MTATRLMTTAAADSPDAWKVWHRAGRKTPWRKVAAEASKPLAAKTMFDLMTGRGGDWLVTGPGAADPNARPAHLRRWRPAVTRTRSPTG